MDEKNADKPYSEYAYPNDMKRFFAGIVNRHYHTILRNKEQACFFSFPIKLLTESQ